MAFDVFEAAYGKGVGAWVLRIAGFVIAMAIFLALFIPTFIYMVWCAGGLFDLAGWRRLRTLQWAGGGKGVLRRLGPVFAQFFRRGFHPWDHNNSYLLKQLFSAADFEPEAQVADGGGCVSEAPTHSEGVGHSKSGGGGRRRK